MTKIKFLKPKVESRTKASIHANGNLGFSDLASKLLNLNTNRYMKIGINEENNGDINLYVEMLDKEEEYTLKINKAGRYYYLKAKNIFDELDIDYKNKRIIYDIYQIEEQGKKYYKFSSSLSVRWIFSYLLALAYLLNHFKFSSD